MRSSQTWRASGGGTSKEPAPFCASLIAASDLSGPSKLPPAVVNVQTYNRSWLVVFEFPFAKTTDLLSQFLPTGVTG